MQSPTLSGFCLTQKCFQTMLTVHQKYSQVQDERSPQPLHQEPDSFVRRAKLANVAGQNVNSPYPEVDNFILSLVNGHGVQGGIRRWNYFCLEELLVYDISKYRWCQNIQRPHKSNNIMILVDLRNEVWYQKCHDPVCKADNYKSKACPLPPDICLSFLLTEDPEDIQYTMDRAGNIELSPNTASHEEFKQTPQLEWDDGADDELYLKVLEDVEEESKQSEKRRKYAEIPDELLLEALNEHETLMT
ncbi:PRIPO protein, partial [Polypterus senegalus]